jgi:hypothetical protein
VRAAIQLEGLVATVAVLAMQVRPQLQGQAFFAKRRCMATVPKLQMIGL